VTCATLVRGVPDAGAAVAGRGACKYRELEGIRENRVSYLVNLIAVAATGAGVQFIAFCGKC
jgi:hypothetical protein